MHRPAEGWTSEQRLLILLFVPVAVISVWRISSTVGLDDEPHGTPSVQERAGGLRIDPNVAPWWELASLPEIGESTAKAIVTYRESNPGAPRPFEAIQDLERVNGVGPKTVAQIAPWLALEERE